MGLLHTDFISVRPAGQTSTHHAGVTRLTPVRTHSPRVMTGQCNGRKHTKGGLMLWLTSGAHCYDNQGDFHGCLSVTPQRQDS